MAMTKNPYRNRWIMLGLIAWVSICLMAAGWSNSEVSVQVKKMWVLAGLTGLVSVIGLSEVIKSDVRAQQQRLMAEARTDFLTGLANRRAFNEELDRRWTQWKRKGTLLSLLLIDVDQFKQLNDSYGHQAGDEILQGIARVLDSTTRDTDLIARYGGDEFAVLLPGTNLSNALTVGERLRANVANYKLAIGETELQTTVTIGLAEVIPTDEQPDALVRRADTSLYAAKDAGRNCCYLHNGSTSEPIDTVSAAGLSKVGKSEGRAQQQQLLDEARTDFLTGLANRRAFHEELDRRWVQWKSQGTPLSLILINVDQLPQVNNSYGQQAADELLQEIAHILRNTMRDTSLIARYGVHELAVLLPETNLSNAQMAGERLRATVANNKFAFSEAEFQATVTVGLAEFIPADEQPDALFRRADTSLYAEKRPVAIAATSTTG